MPAQPFRRQQAAQHLVHGIGLALRDRRADQPAGAEQAGYGPVRSRLFYPGDLLDDLARGGRDLDAVAGIEGRGDEQRRLALSGFDRPVGPGDRPRLDRRRRRLRCRGFHDFTGFCLEQIDHRSLYGPAPLRAGIQRQQGRRRHMGAGWPAASAGAVQRHPLGAVDRRYRHLMGTAEIRDRCPDAIFRRTQPHPPSRTRLRPR